MKVTVLGAGSWGTTVATLTSGRNDTLLSARDAEVAETIRSRHENDRYLAGYPLPEQLETTDDLERAARHAQVLVVGVPSHAFRPTLEAVREYLHPWVPVVSLTKGLEQGSMLRMTEVIKEVLPGPPGGGVDRTKPREKEIMAGQAAASVVRHRGSRRRRGTPAGLHPWAVPRVHEP